MKRLLSVVLLVGALLGLFGQQAALAAGPTWQPTGVAAVAADTASSETIDCMKLMEQAPAKTPCEGLTIDCIAAMGCMVPMTLASDPPALGGVLAYRAAPPKTVLLVLAGRNVAPEPEPPTLLI